MGDGVIPLLLLFCFNKCLQEHHAVFAPLPWLCLVTRQHFTTIEHEKNFSPTFPQLSFHLTLRWLSLRGTGHAFFPKIALFSPSFRPIFTLFLVYCASISFLLPTQFFFHDICANWIDTMTRNGKRKVLFKFEQRKFYLFY
jgi:hypothetical protein